MKRRYVYHTPLRVYIGFNRPAHDTAPDVLISCTEREWRSLRNLIGKWAKTVRERNEKAREGAL